MHNAYTSCTCTTLVLTHLHIENRLGEENALVFTPDCSGAYKHTHAHKHSTHAHGHGNDGARALGDPRLSSFVSVNLRRSPTSRDIFQ